MYLYNYRCGKLAGLERYSVKITEYLDSKNIRRWTTGKNTKPGWVNISCCYCNDQNSNHLGINIANGFYHCWRCGKKGSLEWLIAKLERCSIEKAEEITRNIDFDLSFIRERRENVDLSDIPEGNLLSSFSNHLPRLCRDYLEDRNFDADQLQRTYGLRYGGSIGPDKYRVIVPIIMRGQAVSYTGRDITGRSPKRYKECPIEKTLVPPHQLLFNIDTVDQKIIIVEGVFDVFRIGKGSVATLTTSFTSSQVMQLLDLNLKCAFVIFDSEPTAQNKAQELASMLSVGIHHVERIELLSGDPGDLSEEDARYLRSQLF
jgi:DNA primase